MGDWFDELNDNNTAWREAADAHHAYCLAVVESVDEAKFAERKLTREEYKAAGSLIRNGGWVGMPYQLMTHFVEAVDWQSFKRLPEELQYCAVSERYQNDMKERINQWSDDLHQADYAEWQRDYYADQWASISRVW